MSTSPPPRSRAAASPASSAPPARRPRRLGTGQRRDRAPVPRPGSSAGKQPNLLVILADDLGWADLSATARPRSARRTSTGSPPPAFASPTATRLRRSARRPASASTPAATRAASPAACRSRSARRARSTASRSTTRRSARCSRAQGYDTALIGKWHCGYLPWFSPTRLGWDEFFGNFCGGLDYFSKLNHNGDLRPLRGRGRVRGPPLLHRHRHRARRRVPRAASTTQPVAAQPQLHHAALAVGGPRRQGGQRRADRADQGRRAAASCSTTTAARWRRTARWSRTSTAPSAR